MWLGLFHVHAIYKGISTQLAILNLINMCYLWMVVLLGLIIEILKVDFVGVRHRRR